MFISIIVVFLFFPAEKIPVIAIHDLFSSPDTDWNHCPVLQNKVFLHICHLIHIDQITLMTAQKTFLSDPAFDIAQLVLRNDLTSILQMKRDHMTVAVDIKNIIGIRITELPSCFYRHPVPAIRFQCFLQEPYQLRSLKRLEDITGCFHFVAVHCKIRRSGQKDNGSRTG